MTSTLRKSAIHLRVTLFALLCVFVVVASVQPAHAEIEVNVNRGDVQPLPVAVPAFGGTQGADIAQVIAARPGPDDVPEDSAAARLAAALVPDPLAANLQLTDPFTGRVNLNAVAPGIVLLDTMAVHALNRIDPAITLATLPPFARVSAGTLVGTVKIITYAVPQAALAQAEVLAQRAIRVQPVVRRSAGLLMTDVPGQEDKLIAKGRRAVEARLRALGMDLAGAVTVPHDTGAMARALADLPGEMLLIQTDSARVSSCGVLLK